MARAIERFFPESDIIIDNLPRPSTSSRNDERRDVPLQRIDTGVSSIVGAENGDRPGGFVLVIDGAALLQVCSRHSSDNILVLMMCTLGL